METLTKNKQLFIYSGVALLGLGLVAYYYSGKESKTVDQEGYMKLDEKLVE